MIQKPQLKIRAKFFSINLIKFVGGLPKEQIYWIITDQLLRCGTSIGANIVEAQAGSSKRDFIKFYQIALKSANETKYWLEILKDATSADSAKINEFPQEATELANILGASLLTLKNKR